jgi:FKBP-type peptidyl-prolyl cis-trans isomerase SlyD
VAESPDGEEAVLRVIEVKPDAVVLDGNHPLAGETLHYSVVVREVRPATEEEIERAAAGFEEAGEGFELPPAETNGALGNLVQLGGKKPAKN